VVALHDRLQGIHVRNAHAEPDAIGILRVDERADVSRRSTEDFGTLRGCQPMGHIIDFAG
jgi:hypothetical protein